MQHEDECFYTGCGDGGPTLNMQQEPTITQHLRQKLERQQDLKEIQAQFDHLECWIIYQDDYATLRSKPDFKTLGDLPEVINDAIKARTIALGANIPALNITTLPNLTKKSFDQMYKQWFKTFMLRTKAGERSFLLVYVAGHGVADMQQYFVLNCT